MDFVGARLHDTPIQAACKVVQEEHKSDDGQGTLPNVIEKAFLSARSQWIEEPVISQWATPQPQIRRVLQEVNLLYHQWSDNRPGPFYPFSDVLWMETADLLREAGLPWHNNNLNLPDEVDHSWPFNFKVFERQVVISKGARVGDNQASGYICAWSEANQYGIRALQQELRRQRPTQKPLLVAAHIESSIVESAAQLFGLELMQIDGDLEKAGKVLTRRTGGQRPIIFAATLGNTAGEVDDFGAIRRLSKVLPIFLQVDASRTFDYITTLSASARKRLGLPQLKLRHPRLDSLSTEEDTISAASIVAAGMNSIYPPPAVVLKPRTLGSPSPQLVEYVRGTDGTLAGSRDALGPLLVCLQELRFGFTGIRDVYGRCAINRQILHDMLVKRNIPVKIPAASLDLIVYPVRRQTLSLQREWGLVPLRDGAFLISMQPSVTASHIEALVNSLSDGLSYKVDSRAVLPVNSSNYRISSAIVQRLRQLVSEWRVAARLSGGYPLNQAPYSALGPVIGHFLSISIPSKWARAQAAEILNDRKRSFGLSDAEHDSFVGIFTTGSTMGNRVGLHTALTNCPNAFVYFSTVTHYSVKKIVRDSDDLTGRWHRDTTPRFSEISADRYGRMVPGELVRQVMMDRSQCRARGETHKIILLANLGTTFVGGRDDVLGLRRVLREIGAEIDYVHVDGALDLGFSPDSVCLGPPSVIKRNGVPVVQGITLSHHKAFGIMVSGEVICYSPTDQRLAEAVSTIDPRIVFETWLFQRLYTPKDLLRTSRYCLENANRLRRQLEAGNVVTLFNSKCIITLIERLPPWITQEFHLAPEGDWVHFIAMPHISPAAVDHFVNTIASLDVHFAATFDCIGPLLNRALGRKLRLRRVRCHDRLLFPKVVSLAKRTLEYSSSGDGDRDSSIWLDAFKRQYVYGAISFTAVNADNEPFAIFLAETTAQRALCPGPVLLHPEVSCKMHTMQEIMSQAFVHLSALLDLRLVRNATLM